MRPGGAAQHPGEIEVRRVLCRLVGSLCALAALPAAAAEVRYLSCEVQTTFHKPAPNGTEWTHRENEYRKILRIDATRREVAVHNGRSGEFVPVCSDDRGRCQIQWRGGLIHIDGSRVGSEVPANLDFRRTLTLHGNELTYTIADFGRSGVANMSWSYQGTCAPTPRPAAAPDLSRGATGAAARVLNPAYVDAGPAFAVSAAEAGRALAGYLGNTLWGLGGGKHWFHMWFLDGATTYSGDDEDITSEGKPRTWFVGQDGTGYRLCAEPIPAEGEKGCYPLPQHQVGDSWVQHDMLGDAYFSLLPGRQ